MDIAFPEPTDPRASCTEVFLGYLDFFREVALDKVTGLPARDQVRSRLPSGWSPVELLVHLRHVERRWLEWGFLGLDVGDPWADERDGRWHVPSGLGVVEVIDQLRRQGARTREIVESHPLVEQGRPGPRWNGAEPATLERVLFHLLQEYARHVGQLDVVVELISGETSDENLAARSRLTAVEPPMERERAEALEAAVKAVVDAEDPEGLLAMGAPADEYSPEVPALAQLVAEQRVTAAGVLAVWEYWFGPDSSVQQRPDVLERLTEGLTRLRG